MHLKSSVDGGLKCLKCYEQTSITFPEDHDENELGDEVYTMMHECLNYSDRVLMLKLARAKNMYIKLETSNGNSAYYDIEGKIASNKFDEEMNKIK